jgi:acyl dehydratase
VLAFPVQMRLLADRAFPLPLPGLVHLRNTITQLRPVGPGEALTLRVHAEQLVAHPRGAQVDLVARADVGGERVWSSRSTYLARGAAAPHGTRPPDLDLELPAEPTAVWRIPADTGRRYAAVSGDVNPIHLHPLAAKAFGFPRAIAHGMWCKARTVAAVEARLPDAFTVDVAFRKPVLLPATVHHVARATGAGWHLGLRRAGSGDVHLVGAIRPPD